MTDKHTEAPERIYLQIGDEETTYHEAMEGEVSWCEDQIFEFDIPYVRADLYEALQARIGDLEKENETLKAT